MHSQRNALGQKYKVAQTLRKNQGSEGIINRRHLCKMICVQSKWYRHIVLGTFCPSKIHCSIYTHKINVYCCTRCYVFLAGYYTVCLFSQVYKAIQISTVMTLHQSSFSLSGHMWPARHVLLPWIYMHLPESLLDCFSFSALYAKLKMLVIG